MGYAQTVAQDTGRMIISHKHRFIYFANARTGTTSIELALRPFHDGDDLLKKLMIYRDQDSSIVCPNIKHMRPASLCAVMDKEEWDSCFKFVFVRNPWDWVISQYLRHNTDSLIARGYKKFSIFEFYHHWYRMKRYRGFRDDPSYLQYRFIENMDYIGRFESLENDFKHICRKIGITTPKLAYINDSGSRWHYRDYYNAIGRELVRHYYQEDISRLQYKF